MYVFSFTMYYQTVPQKNRKTRTEGPNKSTFVEIQLSIYERLIQLDFLLDVKGW